jgi:hypothetical protein
MPIFNLFKSSGKSGSGDSSKWKQLRSKAMKREYEGQLDEAEMYYNEAITALESHYHSGNSSMSVGYFKMKLSEMRFALAKVKRQKDEESETKP